MESPEMDKKPIDEEPKQSDRPQESPDTMPTAASIRFPIPKAPDTTPERDELMRQIKERSRATRNSDTPGPELPPFVNKAPDKPKEKQQSPLSRLFNFLRGK